MAKQIKTRKGKDDYYYPYTSPDLVIDNTGKSATTRFEEIEDNQLNLIEDGTTKGIKDTEYDTLTTTNKTVIGSINELSTQFKDIAKQTITTDERNKLNSLENYDDSQIKSSINKKADKNEVFSMVNMGQDIKEAMTGGSVAVVGEDMVLEPNIVNNQININKFDEELQNVFVKQFISVTDESSWIMGKDVRTNGVEVTNKSFMYTSLDVCKGDTIVIINYINTVASVIPVCYIMNNSTMYDKFKSAEDVHMTGSKYQFTASKSGKLYINQAIKDPIIYPIVVINNYVKINDNNNVYLDYTIPSNIILANKAKIIGNDGELIDSVDGDRWYTSDYIEINKFIKIKSYSCYEYPAFYIYDCNKKPITLGSKDTAISKLVGVAEKTIYESEGAFIRVCSYLGKNASDTDCTSIVNIKRNINEYVYDNLNNINVLKNKKCFVFGDSISDETTASSPSSIYVTYLRDNYEMNITSYACFGSGYCFDANWNTTNNGINNICRRIEDAPSEDIDYCILAGGTNDWDFAGGGGVFPLGEFDHCLEGDTNNSFANRVGTAIRSIWSKYPKCKILIITPLPRFGKPSWDSSITCNPLTTNRAGIKLSEYRDMLEKIANYYSVPILDMTYNSNIRYGNNDYLKDGLHPTPWYAEKYADIIASKLKTI